MTSGHTTTMTEGVATRRFATLSFLTWLPVGLSLVPFVLLVLARGFTLADVALLVAASAVTVAVLELPTGGLADTLGRRPVMVMSALAHAAGLVVLGLAGTLTILLLSAVLRGAARALTTGPLEAWYVDTVHAARAASQRTGEHDLDSLTTGLSRGEVASSAGLAAGTLAGGALPLLGAVIALPVPALAVPVLLAAGVEVLRAALSLGLPDHAPAARSPKAVLHGVPTTVNAGLRLAGRDRVLLRLLLVAGATGVALAVLELVTPAWLGDLAADPTRSALVYSLITAVGFGADAAGAALAPVVRRRATTPASAGAVGTAVALLATGVLTAATELEGALGLALVAAAFLGIFVGLGNTGPPLGELLHQRVVSSERATVLSVQSLLLQVAGGGGALLAGWLTAEFGAAAGFGVGVAGLAAGLVLLVLTHRATRVPRLPTPAPSDRQAQVT